jgi:hypothetical protein
MFGFLKLLDPRAGLLLKTLAVVSLLLASSAALNAWQWRAWAVREADYTATRAGEIAVAMETGKRLAAEEQAGRAAQVASFARTDNAELLARFDAIADRAEQRTVVYRTRAVPVANCPPGAERMARTNELLQP